MPISQFGVAVDDNAAPGWNGNVDFAFFNVDRQLFAMIYVQ